MDKEAGALAGGGIALVQNLRKLKQSGGPSRQAYVALKSRAEPSEWRSGWSETESHNFIWNHAK